MRRLFILIAVIALVVPGTGLVSSRAAAQEDPIATPAAVDEGNQFRGVPAEECQVAPRPSEEVFALLGIAEGAGGAATPAADRTPVPAPPWQAASMETVEAAATTIREWLACINADDNLRIAALMTDKALVRFFGGGLVADEAIEGVRANLAGTPVPRTEEEHVRLVTVTDVSLLEDGRVAALALLNEPVLPPHGQETLLVILTQADDRLLIDDIVQFSVVPTAAATPSGGGAVTTGSVTARVFVCPAESNRSIDWDELAAEWPAYEANLLAVCDVFADPAVAPQLVTLPDQESTLPGTEVAPGVYRWTDVPFGDYLLGGENMGMPSGSEGVLVVREGLGPVQNPPFRLDAETTDVEYRYFYFLTAATPESN
jgi:hypothetical protein